MEQGQSKKKTEEKKTRGRVARMTYRQNTVTAGTRTRNFRAPDLGDASGQQPATRWATATAALLSSVRRNPFQFGSPPEAFTPRTSPHVTSVSLTWGDHDCQCTYSLQYAPSPPAWRRRATWRSRARGSGRLFVCLFSVVFCCFFQINVNKYIEHAFFFSFTFISIFLN